MKTTFLISILLIQFNTQAQVTLIKASAQQWAGGVCCSSGTNYSIQLNMPKATFKKLEIESICFEGNHYEFTDLRLNSIDHDSIVYLTINFGFSSNYREVIGFEQIEIEKVKTKCDTSGIRYRIGTTLGFLTIEKIEQLPYLAYP